MVEEFTYEPEEPLFKCSLCDEVKTFAGMAEPSILAVRAVNRQVRSLEERSGKMGQDWQKLHEAMGCLGCFYADEEAVGKGACCTFPGGLKIGDGGRCLTRKDKE